MRTISVVGLLSILYALHQDVWFWRASRPLVFGFLPIGLFYHAAFTLACAIVLFFLVKLAWPAHLEVSPDTRPGPGPVTR
jgi:hypothetical protein